MARENENVTLHRIIVDCQMLREMARTANQPLIVYLFDIIILQAQRSAGLANGAAEAD